jgi:DNA-binding CsgD family transcriptional regulator
MPTGRYHHLTGREREVVTLLAQGMTAKEVAAALSISPNTVEKHVETVMIKLRARNRLQMALIAVANGLIDIAICRTDPGTNTDQADPGDSRQHPRRST